VDFEYFPDVVLSYQAGGLIGKFGASKVNGVRVKPNLAGLPFSPILTIPV
jgi:hypothetical protein